MKILLLSLLAFASAIGQNLSYSGGEPVVIVFPEGYRQVKWNEGEFDKFVVSTKVLVDFGSGKVKRVVFPIEGGLYPLTADVLKAKVPPWQMEFYRKVDEALSQWRFTPIQFHMKRPELKEITEVYLALHFQFRRDSLSQSVKIFQGDDLIANDRPNMMAK